MSHRRKSIPLKPHENRALRKKYLAWRFPLDQYAQRPRQWSHFVAEWNDDMGRSDSGDDLRHYIITKRKAGKWVRFNGDYERLRSPKKYEISASDWDALLSVYLPLNAGRDQLAFNDDLRAQISAGFAALTGKHITGELLYAFAMAMQKHRGNGWPRLPKGKLGFSDVTEVA